MKISDQIRESKAGPEDEKLKNDFNDTLRQRIPEMLKKLEEFLWVFRNYSDEVNLSSFPKTPVGKQVKATHFKLRGMMDNLEDWKKTLKKGTLFVK